MLECQSKSLHILNCSSTHNLIIFCRININVWTGLIESEFTFVPIRIVRYFLVFVICSISKRKNIPQILVQLRFWETSYNESRARFQATGSVNLGVVHTFKFIISEAYRILQCKSQSSVQIQIQNHNLTGFKYFKFMGTHPHSSMKVFMYILVVQLKYGSSFWQSLLSIPIKDSVTFTSFRASRLYSPSPINLIGSETWILAFLSLWSTSYQSCSNIWQLGHPQLTL